MTYDQLTHLHSAPLEIIPAPGADKVINASSVFGVVLNQTQDFVGWDASVDGLYYKQDAAIGLDTAQRIIQVYPHDGMTDDVIVSKPILSPDYPYEVARVSNQSIIYLTGQDWTGGDAATTLRLVVYYTIEDLV